jgi:DNA-binding MarR family transcriptional regulator
MEKKIIPLPPTSGSTFFRQYLELLNPLLKLRGKELDVLAELLYYNHKLIDIPLEHRWKLIFDYDTKMEIRSKLKLSDASMNNNLSALRKKGVIENNKVKAAYVVLPENKFVLGFQFNIKDAPND